MLPEDALAVTPETSYCERMTAGVTAAGLLGRLVALDGLDGLDFLDALGGRGNPWRPMMVSVASLTTCGIV